MRRALVLLLLVAALAAPAPAGAARPEAVRYQPPVSAPVVDGFRPPTSPYGPGNRGLEYGTEPGTAVQAAAAGTVTFAGPVGRDLHVTVLHADRLRTTYAFLATIGVQLGDRVEAGAAVGTAGGRLLWTARLGAAYVDPSVLLAASGHAAVHLVADDLERPPGRAGGHGRSPVTAAAARWALGGPR